MQNSYSPPPTLPDLHCIAALGGVRFLAAGKKMSAEMASARTTRLSVTFS